MKKFLLIIGMLSLPIIFTSNSLFASYYEAKQLTIDWKKVSHGLRQEYNRFRQQSQSLVDGFKGQESAEAMYKYLADNKEKINNLYIQLQAKLSELKRYKFLSEDLRIQYDELLSEIKDKFWYVLD